MNRDPAPITPIPPRRPTTSADRDFRKGLRFSLIAHGALLSIVIVRSLVFPNTPIPYIPTLRVDIVGLPDLMKNERLNQPPPGSPEAEQKETPAKPAPKVAKEDIAEPDEMVLKAKRLKEEKSDKARKKKISNALARIKALDKISGDVSDSPKEGTLVKGNMISAGSSLSGDARESSEANYYDALRGRLQDNWALPVWLARQNFSAQVQIFIDGRGNLRNYRFTKVSGNAQFDAAVKKAVMDSQPYPLPPEKLAGSLLVDGILVGFPL
ncbi:MAG: hypothetical protein A2X94_00025 [Bdellovibrionales bacterium GWB1_55_8]|nr:MAG: hypothetical protein A2X94_00025 [Bdellovibrionales bacterium GWB1_55_8]